MKIAMYDEQGEAQEFEAGPEEIEEIFSIADKLPDGWVNKNNGAEKMAESIKKNINKVKEGKP